jgi:hypothetical protein
MLLVSTHVGDRTELLLVKDMVHALVGANAVNIVQAAALIWELLSEAIPSAHDVIPRERRIALVCLAQSRHAWILVVCLGWHASAWTWRGAQKLAQRKQLLGGSFCCRVHHVCDDTCRRNLKAICLLAKACRELQFPHCIRT